MKYTIMLVEDEPPILFAMKHLIETGDYGFSVMATAPNGREALKLLEARVPDVIITDIQMPFINGLDLIDEVNRSYPQIKSVILTGHSDFEYARKALRSNAVDYLLKPIQVEQLRSLLLTLRETLTRNQLLEEPTQNVTLEKPEVTNASAAEIVEHMETYFQNNFTSVISYKMFYDLFGFNETYLSHVFKVQRGISPNKYVTKLRIEKAKDVMLLQPEIPFKKIAALVGYDDAFYFSRVFKETTGISPSEYLKNSKNC